MPEMIKDVAGSSEKVKICLTDMIESLLEI